MYGEVLRVMKMLNGEPSELPSTATECKLRLRPLSEESSSPR